MQQKSGFLSFLKKKLKLIVIIVLVVIYLIFFYLISKKEDTSQQKTPPTANKQADFKNVVPGKSTESDVKENVGTPDRIDSENTTSNYLYKNENSLRKNSILITDDKVTFVKEIVTSDDKITANEIVKEYGLPPYTLYEKYPNSILKLYTYPEKGIAYLGYNDGRLFEIWYFVPLSIDEFNKTWGNEYLTSPPTNYSQ